MSKVLCRTFNTLYVLFSMRITVRSCVIVNICVAHEHSQRVFFFFLQRRHLTETYVGADKKTSKTVRADYLKTLIASTHLDCISLGFAIMKLMLIKLIYLNEVS